MAYSSNLCYPYPSLAWDIHNIGVFNADMSMVMESTEAFLSSPADLSTGYLQDALVEWSDRFKRRRLQFSSNDQTSFDFDHLLQSYSNSNCTENPLKNYNCLSQQTTEINGVSAMSSISDEETIVSEIKTTEETMSAPETLTHGSSGSSCKNPQKPSSCTYDKDNLLISRYPLSSSEGRCQRKRKVITGVAYPFALVKPGGVEGDVTLNDINQRILMPPTRPVRHPVGDFACRPCVSPSGTGLSGKAVVALTRIHTQGRGTITIIRTRG
ncbi:PREDICTED: protein XRI1-like isoform X2 [Nelumbo nucifera]|uniref:Protein XRI1-like isoform X2 n=1 Tax=Nelumbo nucifera TaxID=4432 RepID=A0A1U7YYX0_NELNU|nr:PREDICTED: protein XRI1-like isoform X2 [Nelumbo nucifera]